MLNDDQNRVTGTNPVRQGGMGRGMMAAVAAVVVLGLLFMWAPWNGPKVANAPGTTVGSSTTSAPSTAPATTTPSSPSTR